VDFSQCTGFGVFEPAGPAGQCPVEICNDGFHAPGDVGEQEFSIAVTEALLPSAMFCFPERAACTIWSMVRFPRL
jgi:hypothetical protein